MALATPNQDDASRIAVACQLIEDGTTVRCTSPPDRLPANAFQAENLSTDPSGSQTRRIGLHIPHCAMRNPSAGATFCRRGAVMGPAAIAIAEHLVGQEAPHNDMKRNW
jgi:hypothetical protein